MNRALQSARELTTWNETDLLARRRILARASLRWWVIVAVTSTAAFLALSLIERGVPGAVAALPFLAAGGFRVAHQPAGDRTRPLLWAAALAVAVMVLSTLASTATVLIVLAALMFGTWMVALLALLASWGHWWLVTFLHRAAGFTEHVREQTEQAASREQGSTT